MATLSEQQTFGIISLVMILSGAVIAINMEQSFYCENEDNVKECLRLSSTNITCYYLTGSDRCTGGKWQPLKNFLGKSESTATLSREGAWYTRDPDGTTCYEQGSLRRPVAC